MKKFTPVLKFVTAMVASFAFLLGSATVLQVSAPAQAASTPFTCTPDFYQVSAGNMYHYSVSTNTYTLMSGSTNIAGGLNAIGYNPADNYIYGVGKTTSTSALGLFQIASDGSHGAEIPVTGATPSSTAGDFIAPNKLLTTTNMGVFTLIDLTTATPNVTAFTTSGATWKAADFAYNQSTNTGYGMAGTTLYIGVVSGTNVAVTTKTVTGSQASGANDAWGAAYVDSAGNGYFFDNTTFDLVEIGATGTNSMASATPAALSITQANSLTSPNDGASCETASSPLAPTVTTGSAASVTTTSATLNGSVTTGIPASSNVTTGNIVMCYSLTNTVTNGALSDSPVCAPTTPSSMAANSTQAVSLGVSGLSSGTTYYYQLEATNAYGLEGFGAVQSLTTVAVNHTVSFNNNGGAGTMANETNNAATALTTNAFTRAGYTFNGWNTNAGGTGTAYADGASYPFTADATLYAQWTAIPNKTVTFNANNGAGTMANEAANVPTALTTNAYTRAGYTFGGWNTNANGSGTAYANGATYSFSADTVLYAQWNAIPNKTVTFNANNGTGTMAPESNNVPAALTSDTFTRAGYTFGGWNTQANGSGTSYTDGQTYGFGADVTLYAQWTPIPNKTVTFNANNGTGTMANQQANVPTALNSDTFTRVGYTFAGWNTQANGGGTPYADNGTFPFGADTTLYAQWTAIPNKTVTFDSNNGTGTMAPEVNNVPAALTTDSFTRAGYTFNGWNTQANGSGTSYTDGQTYGFGADVTLYAQWTAIASRTVTFDANNGNGTMAAESSNVPAALTTDAFTRVGYTFGGWNTQANGGGTSYTDGQTYPFSSDATLYAQWNAIPNSTVTFHANNGAGTMADESANVTSALTMNSFTRSGYTFGGWNTQADGGGTGYTDGQAYSFAADLDLYAVWIAIPNQTVTFNANNGSGTMPNEVSNVPTALTTDAFTRSGYTFVGWNTQANGGGTSYTDGQSYPFDASVTLYAQWTAIPNQTVTFNANNGSGTMAPQADNVPTDLDIDAYTRLGYTFAGWNTQANGSGTSYTDGQTYPFDSSTTLYAQWAAIPNATVTFDNNGGTGTMSNQVDNIPTNLIPDTFTRAGYSFAGWNTQANGGGTSYIDTASYPFSSDATLYAQWTPLASKTVTFDNNGGTGTMSNEVDNVPTALTANTFTRTGYTFAGWNTQANGSGTDYADGDSYAFSANATMYAQWTAIPNSTVTFDANNGSGTMADQSDNVPTALDTNAFTRSGYTFIGWNTQADGSGTTYTDGASYPFGSDATLYAQWTSLPVKTVTFNANNGTGTMANESNNVAAALTADAYTRAGYTFAGWNTQANGGGTSYGDAASYPFTADATLYAQWTAIPNKTVTFDPNNGSGTMANESHNVATPLTANAYTRTGYTFTGWNTQANGSGTPYANNASYAFTADATVYAQWTALPVLTFDANGGTGTVAPMTAGAPTALPTTTVTKPGYTFTGWNTQPDGTGTAYAPGALYPFSGNGVLYAQFTKILAFTGVDATTPLTLGLILLVLGLGTVTVVAMIRRKREARATSL